LKVIQLLVQAAAKVYPRQPHTAATVAQQLCYLVYLRNSDDDGNLTTQKQKREHLARISCLLGNGVSCDISDPYNCTAGHMAAWFGDQEALQALCYAPQCQNMLSMANCHGLTCAAVASKRGWNDLHTWLDLKGSSVKKKTISKTSTTRNIDKLLDRLDLQPQANVHKKTQSGVKRCEFQMCAFH